MNPQFEGEFESDALLGYLAGIPSTLTAELASCRASRGEVPSATFPPKLAAAAPPIWRFCRNFSLDYARAHAKRGTLPVWRAKCCGNYGRGSCCYV